jgi:hypothetical protein
VHQSDPPYEIKDFTKSGVNKRKLGAVKRMIMLREIRDQLLKADRLRVE